MLGKLGIIWGARSPVQPPTIDHVMMPDKNADNGKQNGNNEEGIRRQQQGRRQRQRHRQYSAGFDEVSHII